MRISTVLTMALLAAAMPAGAQRMIGGIGAPLYEQDAGKVIPVAFGTMMTITLKGNAGTGYAWRVTRIVNAKQVGSISVDADPATRPGVVGGPVFSTVKLRFPSRGRAMVTLALVPPGRGRAPARFLDYRFQIR